MPVMHLCHVYKCGVSMLCCSSGAAPCSRLLRCPRAARSLDLDRRIESLSIWLPTILPRLAVKHVLPKPLELAPLLARVLRKPLLARERLDLLLLPLLPVAAARRLRVRELCAERGQGGGVRCVKVRIEENRPLLESRLQCGPVSSRRETMFLSLAFGSKAWNSRQANHAGHLY